MKRAKKEPELSSIIASIFGPIQVKYEANCLFLRLTKIIGKKTLLNYCVVPDHYRERAYLKAKLVLSRTPVPLLNWMFSALVWMVQFPDVELSPFVPLTNTYLSDT